MVKVCNFRSNDFKSDFVNSLRNTGFAVVTHHGLDHDLIREVQSDWKKFFQIPSHVKEEYINKENSNMGYSERYKEKGIGALQADLKEFYHYKPGQRLPWIASKSTFKLYSLLEHHIAPQMLLALNGVGSNMDYAEVCKDSDNSILRALYYPALSEMEVKEGSVRTAAHEDINFITLLVAASAPGLQVMDTEGRWHDVPFEENSITVNIGDQLQLASNREFKSTTHRVVNPIENSTDRISLPFFVHPKGSTILAPGITAQQYLDERLDQIYQKVK